MSSTYLPPGDIVARLPLRSDNTLRLSTLLAATGYFTRKQIKHARPSVNGRMVQPDTKLDFTEGEAWKITMFGETFLAERDPSLLLAMHKPTGVVTSHARGDLAGSEETVFDLLPDWLLSEDLEPIGRLDKETSGLLLFSEDGTLSQRMRHPSRKVDRTYRATLARPLSNEHVQDALKYGVSLRDGSLVQPTRLHKVSETEEIWEVVLTEGKYHEVRRLFAALDSHVETLHRCGYGVFSLSGENAASRSGWVSGIPLITDFEPQNGVTTLSIQTELARIEGFAKHQVFDLFKVEPTFYAQICHAPAPTPNSTEVDA